jgi:preprotein translocase subunit SecG
MTTWVVVFLVVAIVVIAFIAVRRGQSSGATTLRLKG